MDAQPIIYSEKDSKTRKLLIFFAIVILILISGLFIYLKFFNQLKIDQKKVQLAYEDKTKLPDCLKEAMKNSNLNWEVIAQDRRKKLFNIVISNKEKDVLIGRYDANICVFYEGPNEN
jgi:hypothetical protein